MDAARMATQTNCPVVLVLDDDPIIGELLSVVLGRAGFEPLAPADWTAAIDLATERGDSVVAAICDLQLGEENGAAVIAKLRSVVPELRAVLMSGHSEAHIQAELDRFDTHAIVFQKPFRAAELVAAISAPSSVAG